MDSWIFCSLNCPNIYRSLPPKYLWLVSWNLTRCPCHVFPSPRSRIMDQSFLKKSLVFLGWERDWDPGLGMHSYTVAIEGRQLAPVMAALSPRMGQDLLCMVFMYFYAFYVMISLLSYLSRSQPRASQFLFSFYLSCQLSPIIHVQHPYSRSDKLYYILSH